MYLLPHTPSQSFQFLLPATNGNAQQNERIKLQQNSILQKQNEQQEQWTVTVIKCLHNNKNKMTILKPTIAKTNDIDATVMKQNNEECPSNLTGAGSVNQKKGRGAGS